MLNIRGDEHFLGRYFCQTSAEMWRGIWANKVLTSKHIKSTLSCTKVKYDFNLAWKFSTLTPRLNTLGWKSQPVAVHSLWNYITGHSNQDNDTTHCVIRCDISNGTNIVCCIVVCQSDEPQTGYLPWEDMSEFSFVPGTFPLFNPAH